MAQTIKNLPTLQEIQVQSLGWEDSPGEGNGYSLQYACLENPMDREAWKAPVHVRMALPASKPSKHTYRLLETASEWSHRGGHIWAVLALSP